MWAEGFAEWVLIENDIEEIEKEYLCPPWVRKGIENQGIRSRMKNEKRNMSKNKNGKQCVYY